MRIDKESEVAWRLGKLRVVHVYDGHERVLPGEGSVPSIVFFLATHVGRMGHDITVLERRWSGVDAAEEQLEGVRFVRIPSQTLASTPYLEFQRGLPGVSRLFADRTLLAWRFRRFLSQSDFDVLHVHTPFVASLLIALDSGVARRMVYTAHIGEERKRLRLGGRRGIPPLLRLFSPDLYVMKRVAKVVVLNERLKRQLISRQVVEESRACVIPGLVVANPASLHHEVEAVRARHGARGKMLVVFGGTITPRKGVRVLVEAARILVHEFECRNVVFALAGDTGLDEAFVGQVRRLIRVHGLDEQVKLLGFIAHHEFGLLLEACDAFVLPSFDEGESVALREALAIGKPLVGTDVGGIPPQIRDGWNGFLVPPGSPSDLARALRTLIGNEELRSRMAQNSLCLAREVFNPERIASEYVRVYEAIAGKGGEGRRRAEKGGVERELRAGS